jgi:hypothetical protein
MSKLRLNIENLVVESFDTATAGTDGRGTVQGHGAFTGNPRNCAPTQPCAMSDDDPTCAISCGYAVTGCPRDGACGIA